MLWERVQECNSEIQQGNGKWQGFYWPSPNMCLIAAVEMQESPPLSAPLFLVGFCCFVLLLFVVF